MTIQSVLGSKSAEVFTIGATETVKGATEQMRQHGLSALVVKGDEAIKGIISDRRLAARGSCNLSSGVGPLVPCLVTVAPGDSVKRAMGTACGICP
jgi:CBS domain-containing protein